MSLISKIFRDVDGGGLMFWCPGCDGAHQVRVGEGAGPRWGWNGSFEAPTFSPSILVRGRDFTAAGRAAYQRWYDAGRPEPTPSFESADTVCHSFVADGRIQFLTDCTHGLAGQTVNLPAWDDA